MKNKIILSLALMLFSLNITAKESATDEYLWSQQESYVKNMKDLLSGLQDLNNNLEKCRDHYYINKTDEEKKSYIGATNDYSTNLVVTSTILIQSIGKLDDTMANNKEVVLKNLRDYESTIEELLKKEKDRNINMLNKYKTTFKDINKIYCPKIIFKND